MNNIYFVGMPGCGKSTLGSMLSQKLCIEFIDADEYIIKREGRTIAQIFEDGEAAFRTAETNALKEIALKDNILVATGGGIVTVEENIDIMKSTGKVVFIDARPDFILSNSSLEGRPLMKDKSRIYDMYNNRISLYRKSADYTIGNNGILSDVCKSLEEVVIKIMRKQ